MAEEKSDYSTALSTETRNIGGLSTEFADLGSEDVQKSYYVQAAIYKDMVQASLMIGNMEFVNMATNYLSENVHLYTEQGTISEQATKFFNEILTDIFSKFIKSSLNSVESTFESVLGNFHTLELIISNAAGGLWQKDEEGKLIYAEKTPINSGIVYNYYSKIATFVYQNSDASSFQKSFYFYAIYNRPFFNHYLDKSQLLFPHIKDTDLTDEIKLLSSQIRYTVSTLIDKENLSTVVVDSFLNALKSRQWTTDDFYKHSTNFAISLCENSNLADIPIEFLTTLSNSLEKEFGAKGTAKLKTQVFDEFTRVPGKVCYQVYKHFVESPEYSRSAEKDVYSYNAEHVHDLYTNNAKLGIEKLYDERLKTANCNRIKDHSLIKNYFTPETIGGLFDKFSRYTDAGCFAGFVFQMLSEKEAAFMRKIEEFLDTEEDNYFQEVIKNSYFWKELNHLLNARYTIEKHIAICDFWTFRVSEELQNKILEKFKGQDHYGYMRMCELSRMEESARVQSNIESIIRKYGDTKLLGMVSFMLTEKISFHHNETYNFYLVMHDAIKNKLPAIEAAKKQLSDKIGHTFLLATAKKDPEELKKLLKETGVITTVLKPEDCKDHCPPGGAANNLLGSGDTKEYVTAGANNKATKKTATAAKNHDIKSVSAVELTNKMHTLLDEECHNSFRTSICDKVTSYISDFYFNHIAITGQAGAYGIGIMYYDWLNMYKVFYGGVFGGDRHTTGFKAAYNFFKSEAVPFAKYPAFAVLGYTVITTSGAVVGGGIKKVLCDSSDYLHLTQSSDNQKVHNIELSPQYCTGNVTYAKELADDFCEKNNFGCDVKISDFE